MDFDLSDDQVALRDGIRAVCQGRFGSERVRAGFDRAVHGELAETGVFSLRTDGFTWADTSIAFQELGRALVPGPLVWTHLAHGGPIADGIVAGVERASGTVMLEHLDVADAIVVLGESEITSFAPDAFAGAEPIAWPLDPLTPVHRVDVLPPAEAGTVVADADEARAWMLGGSVLTAAYQVGMAQTCVEAATAYSQERRQFDRPIGSFQAVKHILADMAVRAEIARAAVDAAAVMLDEAGGDADEPTSPVRAASGARLLADEAAVKNAKASMQVHGGMGFTWEVDVHLFLKRAWVLSTTFGTAGHHADTLAAALG